jgi:hypothetical protein
MPDSIAARLASLPKINKTDLRSLWKELFQNQPPQELRRNLMIPILGYRLQEVSLGSLTPSAMRKLSQTVEAIKSHRKVGMYCSPHIKPGTRLIRQWQSDTHVIHAEEQGYEYRGHRYDSLSEIARLITGTRRSGPLFFGLKGKQAENSKEAA